MRRSVLIVALATCVLTIEGCGGSATRLIVRTTTTSSAPSTSSPAAGTGFPVLATKNTTRVSGVNSISNAAGVALAVFPSSAPGTHPTAVTLAPTDDWEAAIAASVLMAPPIRAPILLSGATSLPQASANALTLLAPTGSGQADGAQVIRVGDVPAATGLRGAAITGNGPYALAAAIDKFASAAAGKPSPDVVIASADYPGYAMPAAGWAAESGDPVLFVNASGVPAATASALKSDQMPHIYVLGPPSVIPDTVLTQLRQYGTVNRVGDTDPAANSVAFAVYRDPPCVVNQACAHVPGSFGWAMRSPGHGYTLINANRTLDAAASSALSASGSYGPQLLIDDPNTLPQSVLNFFLDYATPGYTAEGPTAAVYNHGWVIGDPSTISVSVQAQMDSLLEVVQQK
ncbi:MAG TPA: cell wall-binding repeat-containing protein [Solirubrobacteraceae bacterium]|nr:cell wall-binding repeat-containing protein [Solirubrobacteraceae bacterium]